MKIDTNYDRWEEIRRREIEQKVIERREEQHRIFEEEAKKAVIRRKHAIISA